MNKHTVKPETYVVDGITLVRCSGCGNRLMSAPKGDGRPHWFHVP